MKFIIIGWSALENISGGMDIHIHNIAKKLALKGHMVSVFIHETQTNINKHKQDNITYIAITSKTPNESKNDTEFLKLVENYNNQIIKHSNNIDFDIIISHDWFGVKAAKKLKKNKKIIWIHTVHSLEYMRSLNETKKINLKNTDNNIQNLEKDGITDSDILFTVSNYMKTEIQKKYNKNAIVIYNGPSITKNKILIKIKNKPPEILYVGRLTAQKGIEYLILASKKILEKYPYIKFLIAGNGELKESLKTFALTIGVSKNFNFLGFVSDEKLIELYTKASVFVTPSIYEPFGITLLDAALFECPIITTKNTGAIELFQNDLITVIESQNSNSLSNAIINILENPQTHKANAKKLKKQIENIDYWNRAADILINEIKNKIVK